MKLYLLLLTLPGNLALAATPPANSVKEMHCRQTQDIFVASQNITTSTEEITFGYQFSWLDPGAHTLYQIVLNDTDLTKTGIVRAVVRQQRDEGSQDPQNGDVFQSADSRATFLMQDGSIRANQSKRNYQLKMVNGLAFTAEPLPSGTSQTVKTVPLGDGDRYTQATLGDYYLDAEQQFHVLQDETTCTYLKSAPPSQKNARTRAVVKFANRFGALFQATVDAKAALAACQSSGALCDQPQSSLNGAQAAQDAFWAAGLDAKAAIDQDRKAALAEAVKARKRRQEEERKQRSRDAHVPAPKSEPGLSEETIRRLEWLNWEATRNAKMDLRRGDIYRRECDHAVQNNPARWW